MFFACQENQPQYTLSRAEIGDRVVVVEEFSGVRCPNCPEGTKELENLRTLYDDKVIIVTIHAGDFAFQYNDSQYDFTTTEGNALLRHLGNPIGYPSAVINRVRDSNTQSLQNFSSQWGSLISAEITTEPVVSLELDIAYDANTRKMSTALRAVPNIDLEGDLRFTLLIKEDNMIDWQSDTEAAQGVDREYNHRNVLRAVLTTPEGDHVASDAKSFQSLEKIYSFTVPEQTNWWKETDLTIVGFVTGSTGEILQGIEKPLIP
ncbi:MAG: Omp28-related outer membrane protein [Saprospiraceae bacterium]|nr:Omp28-related outer membrane protein [Saprospiraceae bacterium]